MYIAVNDVNGNNSMDKEYINIVPKNTFDIKATKDKIAEFERIHDEIVVAAGSCVDKYNRYCELQKELLKSKLPGLVFGICRHTNVKWDKNRYEGKSAGFWICADCNEIVCRNYWISDVNGGWVTRDENDMIDKITTAFFEEYPDIDTDICHKVQI